MGDNNGKLADAGRVVALAGVTYGDLGLDDAAALTELAELVVDAAAEYAASDTGRDWGDPDKAPASVKLAVETAAATYLASAQLRGSLQHLPADALGPVLREGISDAFATPAVRALLQAAGDETPVPAARSRVGARVIGGPSSLPLTHLDDEAES